MNTTLLKRLLLFKEGQRQFEINFVRSKTYNLLTDLTTVKTKRHTCLLVIFANLCKKS